MKTSMLEIRLRDKNAQQRNKKEEVKDIIELIIVVELKWRCLINQNI